MLKAGVIGNPISHSLSPRLHNHWLTELGIIGEYRAHEAAMDGLEATLRDLMAQGYRGTNITIPFKEEALRLSDEASEAARAIGAANTLIFDEGKIHADNTDGFGFAKNIMDSAPGWDGAGAHIILGAGGAARAAICWLSQNGAEAITIINRNQGRAEALAQDMRHLPNMPHHPDIDVANWDALPDLLAGTTTLINTTPRGMKGEHEIAIDFARAPSSMIVNDFVYVPLETRLLHDARQAGLKTVDGLGMLLWQARPGFAVWFGQEPPPIDTGLREMMLA